MCVPWQHMECGASPHCSGVATYISAHAILITSCEGLVVPLVRPSIFHAPLPVTAARAIAHTQHNIAHFHAYA
jgi:hypothetical protein